jgi:hypothetical protein
MAITVGDVLRITARMLFVGNQIQNIYHFLVETADAGDDDDWMADISEVLDTAHTNMLSRYSDSLTFEDISGINITQDEVLPIVAWDTLVVGVNVSDPLAPQVAALAFWGTITPEVVARKFLGVFGVDVQDGGIMDGSTVANVLSYADDIEASVFPNAIDRNAVPGVYRVEPARFTRLGLAQVNEVMMTQRRRTRGRGE